MRRGRVAAVRLALVALAAACTPAADSSPAQRVDYAVDGPFAAGFVTTTLPVDEAGRVIPVDVWTPAAAAGAPPPMDTLVADPAAASTYAALLAAAPAGCPTLESPATPGAPLADGGPWPLVVMSHCHGCSALSTATVAAHLATHGFVVVAPEHAGDTVYDAQAGALAPLDTDTLATREADLAAALDVALAGTFGVPVDPARVGAYGHSFGAVTAGKLLQDRLGTPGAPIAGFFVGAPPDNPLLPGVDAAALAAPVLFERLLEDHSVGEAGNRLIDANFAEAPGPAWEVDVADAGHWSPSDLVGLTADLMPGCGSDTRAVSGEPFTYLDPATGRALSAATAAAFFSLTLNGETDGGDWLAEAPAGLTVTAR